MILGSHNSWSYLKPRHWWMRPFAFMAKCQNVDIRTQYERYGVRCFDLRLRMTGDTSFVVAHGMIEYKYEYVLSDLMWLDSKGDCYVRVIHEARNKRQYTERNVIAFQNICSIMEREFKNIKFWCGRNLYDWKRDYDFDNYPTCDERYASVCKPSLIDDWWPWLYARLHNKANVSVGSSGILLIDFVNIK